MRTNRRSSDMYDRGGGPAASDQIRGPSGFLFLDFSDTPNSTREGYPLATLGRGPTPASSPSTPIQKPRQERRGLAVKVLRESNLGNRQGSPSCLAHRLLARASARASARCFR